MQCFLFWSTSSTYFVARSISRVFVENLDVKCPRIRKKRDIKLKLLIKINYHVKKQIYVKLTLEINTIYVTSPTRAKITFCVRITFLCYVNWNEDKSHNGFRDLEGQRERTNILYPP